MTGTSVDVALVHVEKTEQYEQVNGDKIAEAEALAAEALRMANEAKRAAERLAEVKKTLAMFSKKLDTVEKVVVVKSKDETSVVAPKPESPRMKRVEEPVEEKSVPPPPLEDESTIPPPPADDDYIPPPPPAEETVVVQKKSVAFKEEVQAPTPVATEEAIVEKDMFESTLDKWGVDRMCGVDDEALAQYQAEELGLPAPKPVEKEAPSPKKDEASEAPATARSIAAEPAAAEPVAVKSEDKAEEVESALAVVEDEDEHKDLIEKAIESIGLDRFCGVDDVALGYKDSYPEPVPPPPPVPFENPTRMVVRELSVQQILHAESSAEKHARELRKEQHLPLKVYQRDPVNHDFIDPFGVDHDDFVMCGKLADLCEPDLDELEQPQVYTIAEAPVTEEPAATRAPEPKTEEKVEESAQQDDVSLRGGDPDGNKSSFDSCKCDEKVYATKMTHGNLRSASKTSAETRPVSVIIKTRLPQSVREDRVATVERREDEEVIRRQLQESNELLAAVDSHIFGCV